MFQDSDASQAVRAPAAGQAERHVFVYGTLRRGGSNDINLRRPAPRYVGRSSLKGVLYDLGSYPGLILGPSDALDSSVEAKQVIGEVYAVLPALEDNLDELEGLLPVPTGEYVKRCMTLDLVLPDAATSGGEGPKQALPCIVYEINPERTRGCAVVAHGDWIAHRAEKIRPWRLLGESKTEIP